MSDYRNPKLTALLMVGWTHSWIHAAGDETQVILMRGSGFGFGAPDGGMKTVRGYGATADEAVDDAFGKVERGEERDVWEDGYAAGYRAAMRLVRKATETPAP